MTEPGMTEPATTAPPTAATCPSCNATVDAGAQFCEACGTTLAPGAVPASALPAPAGGPPGAAGALPAARPATAPESAAEGEESPLDIGWTGVVPGAGPNPYEQAAPAAPTCVNCGEGSYLDGYCDQCGAKQPNPRDHLEEQPSDWVGGVSDVGRRHTRNEDSLALASGAEPVSTAALVVCDGVSNTTDSDIASLAAARAARTVLEQPLSAGMGLPEAASAAAVKRLGEAVAAANAAVIKVTKEGDPAAPSCTFTGAIVTGRTAYVGNVGDSRIYWLPDAGQPRQLSTDDSVAAAQIAQGVERKVAETGPMAHSITRWLGSDAPDDLTPHTSAVELSEAGWLMLCSDGLWNYCSEAGALRDLIATTIADGAAAEPVPLARALVDFANTSGGADNITVALARVPATAPATAQPTDLAGSQTEEGS